MDLSFFVQMGWKSALIAGAALGLAYVLRSRAASDRAMVLRIGVTMLLLLPLAALFLPSLQIEAFSAPAAAPTAAAAPAPVPVIAETPSTYAYVPGPEVQPSYVQAADPQPAASTIWDDPTPLVLLAYLGGLLMVGGRLLLGLFMLQAFVPQLARSIDNHERRRVILRYGAAATCLTGLALLVFLTAGRPLVHLFLSDAYLPAIPGIRLYMIGDCLRVWASLAMFTAFAAGRPGRYAAIEIGTVAVMAALTLLLTESGHLWAPQIAYAAAYGLTALILATGVLLRSDPPLPALSRLRGGRRTPLPGSAPRPR